MAGEATLLLAMITDSAWCNYSYSYAGCVRRHVTFNWNKRMGRVVLGNAFSREIFVQLFGWFAECSLFDHAIHFRFTWKFSRSMHLCQLNSHRVIIHWNYRRVWVTSGLICGKTPELPGNEATLEPFDRSFRAERLNGKFPHATRNHFPKLDNIFPGIRLWFTD